MGSEMASQLLLNPRAIGVSGAVLGLLALVPGLPTVPFLFMAILMGTTSWVNKHLR
jgi:flagellar biosynthesis protein FlhA